LVAQNIHRRDAKYFLRGKMTASFLQNYSQLFCFAVTSPRAGKEK
jgi:hypothetical protein